MPRKYSLNADQYRRLFLPPAERLQHNHKPIRAAKELAQEFGVSLHVFHSRRKRKGAPQPVFRTHTYRSHEVWFDLAEIRAWWNRHYKDGAKLRGRPKKEAP